MKGEHGWAVAYGKAFVILVYFVVATMWLPSWVLGLGPVTRAVPVVHDLIGAAVWLVAMALGLWGLRRSQSEGWI